MSFELKPIKWFILISFFLHIVSLCAATILFSLQRQFRPLFMDVQFAHIDAAEIFVFLPWVFIARIIIIFVLHSFLTITFWRVINCENNQIKQLRILSIVSFIFVTIVVPLLARWTAIDNLLAARNGLDEFAAIITIVHTVSYGLIIRNFAISFLLIAASISWYYCFITTKNI